MQRCFREPWHRLLLCKNEALARARCRYVRDHSRLDVTPTGRWLVNQVRGASADCCSVVSSSVSLRPWQGFLTRPPLPILQMLEGLIKARYIGPTGMQD